MKNLKGLPVSIRQSKGVDALNKTHYFNIMQVILYSQTIKDLKRVRSERNITI